MRGVWLTVALCACLVLLGPVGVQAQSGSGGRTEAGERVPEPYDEDEFPVWLRKLRRAEVILIGAFPAAMLVSTLSFEAYRGARNLVVHGTLVPEPGGEFGSYSSGERKWLLIAGVSVSGVVALVDFLLGSFGGDDEDQ